MPSDRKKNVKEKSGIVDHHVNWNTVNLDLCFCSSLPRGINLKTTKGTASTLR